jgi:SpoVK/Ycf46/Vps4 family AAA+-type ATPase
MEFNKPAWSIEGDSYSQVTAGTQKIKAGVYWHYESTMRGWVTTPAQSLSDSLLDLPGLPTKFILDQISLFWKKSAEYKKYGFLQKRGILLYGPPGCGKTSITNLLKKQIVDNDGVVFLASNGFKALTEGVSVFRKVEPDRPVMTLVEDLESYMDSSNGSNTGSQETAALALYDGERQFNNIVHVATTNKPELLADRFIRRPGRFDLIIGIHPPSIETKEAYLKSICNGHLTQTQLENILDKTEGLSLAYLREIATTYLVLGIPLDETIARLKDHSTKKYTSKPKTGFTIGFTSDENSA